MMLAQSTQASSTEILDAIATADATASHQDAFARAQRHSRIVWVLKGVLPLLGAVTAAVFVVYSYIATPASVAVQTNGSAISDGKLVMANPKLEGFTKENRPYSMNAVRAVQDFQNEGIVELEGIDARLPFDAENWATVDAAHGIYDRDKNTLDIDSEVTVTTSDGMVAKLKSAYLDIGKGGMTTDDPVDIEVDGGKITAEAMSIEENGKVLIFKNRVRMNIDPKQMKSTQQANGDPHEGN